MENITAITDKVFEYLDAVVMPQIFDLLECEKFLLQREQVHKQQLETWKEVNELAALQQEQNKETQQLCRNLLKDFLTSIVPNSVCWFKKEERPQNELFWVISPFEYALMAPATVSIALQQNNELLLGLLIRSDDFGTAIITGEKGSGSFSGDKEYKVNHNLLSTSSIGMQVVPNGIKVNENISSILMRLRREFNVHTIVNRLTENASSYICDVASGDADFALGVNCCYHDIAAAACIAEQAGAVIIDFSGSKAGLCSGEGFFCSNSLIYKEIIG